MLAQIETLEQGQQDCNGSNLPTSTEKIRELEKVIRTLKKEKEEILKVTNWFINY